MTEGVKCYLILSLYISNSNSNSITLLLLLILDLVFTVKCEQKTVRV